MLRKSSLGARRASQPLRMDADTRRPLDTRRGSGIPQPSYLVKGRRSSSETRDGRMSTIQQPALKRSKSQIHMPSTPSTNFITPMRGLVMSIPGSSQSQRLSPSPFSDKGFSSRKSVYSSVASKSGRCVKDSRPLSDKNYQQQEIQRITSFLQSQPEALSNGPKGINLRQLTMKLFVDIFNHLVGFLDGNVSVNMTNYVTEIPVILKRWGYVGNINTSWLKTVNTPHALPHVIGVFSWLVTLASVTTETDWGAVVEDSLQNEEDVVDDQFPYGSSAMYMQHLFTQYCSWIVSNEEAEQLEEQRFIEDLCNRNGVSHEELAEIENEIQNLKSQLSDPKEKAEVEAALEEEKKYSEFIKDYSKCVTYKLSMEDFLNSAETELVEEKRKLNNEEEALRSLQCAHYELKELVSHQIMTVEERDELLKSCEELSNHIRANEELIAVVLDQIYSEDLDMAKRRTNIERKKQAYNKMIVKESCWLPELESLKHESNIMHPDAVEELAEIDAHAKKLKADLLQKNSDLSAKVKELKYEIEQTEEIKSRVLQEVEQYIQRIKQTEESLESLKMRSAEETADMKKTIDSLEAANNAKINCDSLDDAKKKLLDVKNMLERGKAEVEAQELAAKDFFEQVLAIMKKNIGAVLAAEAECKRKQEELLMQKQEKLVAFKNEVDELLKEE